MLNTNSEDIEKVDDSIDWCFDNKKKKITQIIWNFKILLKIKMTIAENIIRRFSIISINVNIIQFNSIFKDKLVR